MKRSIIGKCLKKILVGTLIALVAFNPFLLSTAMAEELASPTASIQTEAAVAVTNSETQVNTTAIGSQIETQLIPVTSETGEVVEPFPSKEPSETSESESSQTTELAINNEAEVVNETASIGMSGTNVATSPASTQIQTGDAIAIANSNTLVNTTLIQSDLELSTVAIVESWDGDIVVDPLEKETASSYGEIAINNHDSGVVASVSAMSNTGSNTESGISTEIITGEANSLAQNNVLVNTTIISQDIFVLLAQNLWLWSGKILNLESPGSVTSPQSFSINQDLSSADCSQNCETKIAINNQAQVSSSTVASADTGSNTQVASESSRIVTGDALAMAVGNTLVNTTMINSRYRQLSLLIGAPWSGNLVFAYPDIEVSAQAPEEVDEGVEIPYTITIKNLGYAVAKVIDTRERVEKEGGTLLEQTQPIAELKHGEYVTHKFNLPTAGISGQTLTMTAWAKTANQEVSMANNTAVVTTKVLAHKNSENTGETPSSDSTSPSNTLRLEAVNNINNYIYPGDAVTYDMKVFNEGSQTVKNIRLIQDFYSPSSEQISQFAGKLGEIGPNQHKNVHFVLQTGTSFPPGSYYTQSIADGETMSGSSLNSNTVKNHVPIKLRETVEMVGKIQPAMALTSEQAQVLGEAIGVKTCKECLAYPWYIAITGGSLAYYFVCRRRREYGEAIRWGLALPLTAYGGLLWSNPDCVSGITFLPGAGWACQVFLPLAYAIYLTIMNGYKARVYASRIAVTTRRLVSKNPVQV